VQKIRHLVTDLLADEGLHGGSIDEAQVYEKFAQSPALEFGALDLQGLGQGFGGEDTGGHQAHTQERSPTRYGHRVDLAIAKPD